MAIAMNENNTRNDAARLWAWSSLILASSLLFSFVFACAAPFAALATLAAMQLERSRALLLVAIAWLVNQAVGYLLLGYPHTVDSYGWGLAIGVAALLAGVTAAVVVHRVEGLARAPIALLASFAIYEGVLFAATTILPSSAEAFSMEIVLQILLTNVGAFVLLAAICAGARLAGLSLPAPQTAAAH